MAGKFEDPHWTAKGERRACVTLKRLETLWVNTGTLCNIACTNCYIESSPRNDRLAYIAAAEVRPYLAQAAALGVREIGFTGGEPFMNPGILALVGDALAAGFSVLVLTNAMRPLQRQLVPLTALHRGNPGRLTLRVSLDHYTAAGHDRLRGAGSWGAAVTGLKALNAAGFPLAVAGRTVSGEEEGALRAGYGRLFAELGLPIDATAPGQLVLFPEMTAVSEEAAAVPEITEACWGILNKDPDQVMCASARMVVKRRGAVQPAVLACTLIADDAGFELGTDLAAAAAVPVALNHPHCARFCVLGGASCS